jgi:DNA-binding PadR family transcriptional regulator
MEGADMKILSRVDEILLLAVLRLKQDAYGAAILKEVRQRTGKEMKIGHLWVALDGLCRKGFLRKRLGEDTPARGGRRKLYYSLTPSGARVLREARDMQTALWRGASTLLKRYNG